MPENESLEEVAEQIADKVKKPRKPVFTDSEIVFTLGCDLTDLAAGGGLRYGIPAGCIINFVGDKSSGKTAQAVETIVANHFKFGNAFKWVYDDCETGNTFQTKEKYGIEVIPEDPKKRVKSKTVEEAFCNIRAFTESLKEDECGIYVLDSLDGLTSEEQNKRADTRYTRFVKGSDKEMEGSYQMGKPKYLSQEFFPQLHDRLSSTKVLLIIVSQTRSVIDPFSFKKYSRAGGDALDFYCHSIFYFANLIRLKKGESVIGHILRALLEKSKTPLPYRKCDFIFYFDYGIDNTGSNIDYLYSLRNVKEGYKLLERANAITWDADAKEKTVQTLKEFIETYNLIDEYKAAYKDYKKSDMIEFLETLNPPHEAYAQTFGTSRTRDELIAYIEANGLQPELTKRVRDKWEANEQAVKTNRAPKFPART